MAGYQGSIPNFLEPVKDEEGGELTFWEYSSSGFAIRSYNNPLFKRDTLVEVEAPDSDFNGKIDLVKIIQEHYGKNIKTEKPIIFLRDGSENSENVFEIVDKLYEKILLILKGEDLSAETIYNRHKEDIDFLLGLVLPKAS